MADDNKSADIPDDADALKRANSVTGVTMDELLNQYEKVIKNFSLRFF
jgi:hypothetical protein